MQRIESKGAGQLDYAVYAIGVLEASKNPPPDARKLQLPITDNPDDFTKGLWRLESLKPDIRSIFECVQPYNRPCPGLPPLLSILRDFNDSDKQRIAVWRFPSRNSPFSPHTTGHWACHRARCARTRTTRVAMERPTADTQTTVAPLVR
jgi:hypothetical protein